MNTIKMSDEIKVDLTGLKPPKCNGHEFEGKTWVVDRVGRPQPGDVCESVNGGLWKLNYSLGDSTYCLRYIYKEQEPVVREYPCQNLMGGAGAGIKDNVDGLCNHAECKPPEQEPDCTLSELDEFIENSKKSKITVKEQGTVDPLADSKTCQDCHCRDNVYRGMCQECLAGVHQEAVKADTRSAQKEFSQEVRDALAACKRTNDIVLVQKNSMVKSKFNEEEKAESLAEGNPPELWPYEPDYCGKYDKELEGFPCPKCIEETIEPKPEWEYVCYGITRGKRPYRRYTTYIRGNETLMDAAQIYHGFKCDHLFDGYGFLVRGEWEYHGQFVMWEKPDPNDGLCDAPWRGLVVEPKPITAKRVRYRVYADGLPKEDT